ncbi:MAG: GNAT family N-acetyltransferase [Candidatus Auribacterota bacterium]
MHWRFIKRLLYTVTLALTVTAPQGGLFADPTDVSNLDTVKNCIPKENYRIYDWFEGSSDITVIAVQDFHCNYPVQKNYISLLQSLINKSDTLGIHFIGVEGSAGLIDTSMAAAYPDHSIRDAVSGYLLKNGIINGIEHFSITASAGVPVIGIDDASLYRKNAELFFRLNSDLLPYAELIIETLEYLDKEILSIGNQQFTAHAASLLNDYHSFLNQSISAFEFAQVLRTTGEQYDFNFDAYPQLTAFLNALDRKRSIEDREIEREKDHLLKRLQSCLPAEEYHELVEADMRYSLGSVSHGAFYTELSDTAKKIGIDMSVYTHISAMNDVAKSLAYIRESALTAEISAFMTGIAPKTAGDQSDIFMLARMLSIMKKMINLTASRDEYLYYTENRALFSLDTIISKIRGLSPSDETFKFNTETGTHISRILDLAASFYEQALKRDHALVANALAMNERLNGTTIVMVTGGFHSNGTAQILEQLDISYLVLTPVINASDLNSGYMETMLNTGQPLDMFLSGILTQLMPPSMFHNLLYPENEALLKAKWLIISSVLETMAEDEALRMTASHLRKKFAQRKTEWLASFENTLRQRYAVMLENGLLSEQDIAAKLESLSGALERIQFDYTNYIFQNNTLAVPMVIQGNPPNRFIVSVSPEHSVSDAQEAFTSALGSLTAAGHNIRIWKPDDFARTQAVSQLLNTPIKTPEFTISPANRADLAAWYTSGIERDFVQRFFVHALDDNAVFLKASSPEGKLLGIVAGKNDDDHSALQVNAIEICKTERKQSIGRELMKAMAQASIERGYNGQLLLSPMDAQLGFYEKLGFEKFMPGTALPTLILKPQNAQALIDDTNNPRNSSTLQLTLTQRQKLTVLLDLFGIDTVDQIMSEMDAYNRVLLLDENISYKNIRAIIDACGLEQAKKLFLWDPKGFFNLVYSLSASTETPDKRNYEQYVSLLTDQRWLKIGENETIPGFVVEPASENDIDTWFSYGITRLLSRSLWKAVLDQGASLYKAVSPTGRIVGLISVGDKEPYKGMEIHFLESCENARENGITFVGTGLIKTAVLKSMEAGYDGQLLVITLNDKEKFYTKLGFEPYEHDRRFLLLTPGKALELINNEFAKEADTSIIINDSAIANFMEIDSPTALQLIAAIKDKTDKNTELTNNEKLFVISQLVVMDEISKDTAAAQLKTALISRTHAGDLVTSIYHRLVNKLLEEMAQGYKPPQRDLVRPVYASLPDTLPGLPENALPEFIDYTQTVSKLNTLKSVMALLQKTPVDRPVRDDKMAVAIAARMLQANGIVIDIQVLPDTDPRIKGKIATTIDNTIYFNETASRSDFWFFLPHEVTHLLGSEYRARVNDSDNIYFMKETANTLLSAANKLPDGEKRDYLLGQAYAILHTAYSFELDWHTARLQLIPEGKAFLEKNQLPAFKNVSDEYLADIARVPSVPLSTTLKPGVVDQLNSFINDPAISFDQFKRKLEYTLVRNAIDYTLDKARVEPDRLNRILSGWISAQLQRRFWQITTQPVPEAVRAFLDTKNTEADIVALQQKIAYALRNMESVQERTALESTLVDWLSSLIRSQFSPAEEINELSDMFEKKQANCLGYCKLFDMIGSRFGLDIHKVILEYEIDGYVELHAANLIKFSDGTMKIHNIPKPPENAKLNGIIASVTSAGTTQHNLISPSRFQYLTQDMVSGVSQTTLDAFLFVSRAKQAFITGNIDAAFENMTRAYQLDQDNAYIASNMAVVSYYHWYSNYAQLPKQEQNADLDNVQAAFFIKYKLFRLGPDAWHDFKGQLDGGYPVIQSVNIISKSDDEGNNAGERNPFRNRSAGIVSQGNTTSWYTGKQPSLPGRTSSSKFTEHHMRTRSSLSVNGSVNAGLHLKTARMLLKTGQNIENMLRNQQFQQAQDMLRSMDNRYAEKIFTDFPLILAFMIELNPAWWSGTDLEELAKRINLSGDLRRRSHLMFASANTEPLDALIKLSDFATKDALLAAVKSAAQEYEITEADTSYLYIFMDTPHTQLAALPKNIRSLMLGVRDEIPVDGGLRIEDGYILGGLFQEPPYQANLPYYKEFIRSLIDEHPQELYNLLNAHPDKLFARKLGHQLDIPIAERLPNSRGLFSLMADHIFNDFSEAEITTAFRENSTSPECYALLEAVFTSNIVHHQAHALIRQIINMNIILPEDEEILSYLEQYYVDGDENTEIFKKGIAILQRILYDFPVLREKVIEIASQMIYKDPGRLLYSFYTLTKQNDNMLQNVPAQSGINTNGRGLKLIEQSL